MLMLAKRRVTRFCQTPKSATRPLLSVFLLLRLGLAYPFANKSPHVALAGTAQPRSGNPNASDSKLACKTALKPTPTSPFLTLEGSGPSIFESLYRTFPFLVENIYPTSNSETNALIEQLEMLPDSILLLRDGWAQSRYDREILTNLYSYVSLRVQNMKNQLQYQKSNDHRVRFRKSGSRVYFIDKTSNWWEGNLSQFRGIIFESLVTWNVSHMKIDLVGPSISNTNKHRLHKLSSVVQYMLSPLTISKNQSELSQLSHKYEFTLDMLVGHHQTHYWVEAKSMAVKRNIGSLLQRLNVQLRTRGAAIRALQRTIPAIGEIRQIVVLQFQVSPETREKIISRGADQVISIFPARSWEEYINLNPASP